MRRIPLTSLKPGTSIGRDIYAQNGQLLLKKGTLLEEAYLVAFRRQGIDSVYIADDTAQKKKHKHIDFDLGYHESLTSMRNMMLEAKLGGGIEEKDVRATVDTLLTLAYDEVDIFSQMRQMKEKDDYLYTHSINVSLLCVTIGRWMKCSANMIKDLGIAGLFHDIGKIRVPVSILLKPDKLTADEYDEIQKHAMESFNLTQGIKYVTPQIGEAIMMHHERMDGSGYPIGVGGDMIPFMARVLAVADVYDAVTSNRVYAPKESPYRAAEILWEESFGRLDPKIAKIFYDRSSNFYIGTHVILSNGQKGKVVYVNPSSPTKPVVEAEGDYHDLARERTISITEILD